jgi:hypothetical protein
MEIRFNQDVLDWLWGNPHYPVLAGAAAWYLMAWATVRFSPRKIWPSDGDGVAARFIVWLLSPLIFPIVIAFYSFRSLALFLFGDDSKPQS